MERSHPTDVQSEQRRLLLVGAVFGVVGGLAAFDLSMDLAEGTTLQHTLVEGVIVLLASACIALGLRRFLALRHCVGEALEEAKQLGLRLEETRSEADRWRSEAQELLQGLGEMIGRQFRSWGLTRAEREVASLVLKGFSHKEIATLRKVSDATVRQQATAIYRKAGVAGRHDLAAFFLEDLLATQGPATQ